MTRAIILPVMASESFSLSLLGPGRRYPRTCRSWKATARLARDSLAAAGPGPDSDGSRVRRESTVTVTSDPASRSARPGPALPSVVTAG